jgi:glycosyltransferase involved in cell wall biosynthesis
VSKSKKTILHVITTISLGGAEKQLVLLTKEQVKLGHKVIVVYLKGNPILEKDFEKNNVIVLKDLVNVHPIVQVWKLHKIISKLKNKNLVIHSHLPRSQLLTGLTNTKVPKVFTRHDNDIFFPNAKPLISKLLSRLAERNGVSWIAISNSVKSSMLVAGETNYPNLIEVVHYGYDKSIEIATDESNASIKNESIHQDTGGVYFIGTVARLVKEKDLETLISAFSLVNAEHPNTRLLIVGGGYLEQELKRYAEELRINDQITWAGSVEDTSKFYRMMSIFVLASRTEGFGLVLLEAMSYGLPIIGSDSPAIPEILGSTTGLIFETGNSKDLAVKIIEIISSKSEIELGRASTNRLMNFASSRMCQEVMNIYEKGALK